MRLRRYEGNPLLKPKPENNWESENVFNPAAIYDRGLFHLLYRGMGTDGISRIGYAVSIDGFNFLRFDKPVISPKILWAPMGCEDPRVVKIGELFYLTYTAYSGIGVRVHLATTENFIQWERHERALDCGDNKNAVLFPEKIDGDYEIRGEVPYVVFACGVCGVGNNYYVYYGGADSVVCVATVDKEELLELF